MSPRLMNYVMIPSKWKRITFHVAKLDWWQEEKNVKKEGRQSSSLLLILSTAMQINYRYQETKESTLSYSLETCPQHKMLV